MMLVFNSENRKKRKYLKKKVRGNFIHNCDLQKANKMKRKKTRKFAHVHVHVHVHVGLFQAELSPQASGFRLQGWAYFTYV